MSAGPFTDDDLAACAQRELRQRRKVYPRLVRHGTMSGAAAEREIAMMEAIARHFEARVAADPQRGGRLL
jgi:hypothetical protein